MTNVLTKNKPFIVNFQLSCSANWFPLIFNYIKCSACHLPVHIVNLTPHVTFSDKIGYLACLMPYFWRYDDFLKEL